MKTINKSSAPPTDILYLIYDGDCFLCRSTAKALKIKKTIGQLEMINARDPHPLVLEALSNGYDLNEGILVKFNKDYYYGAEAFNFLAMIGSSSDAFNKLNKIMFKSKVLSYTLYPLFKRIRKTLMFFQGISPIFHRSQETLMQAIYGDVAESLPKILQMRYSNKPYSNDELLLQGQMNIYISKTFQILSPLFRLTGALVMHTAKNVPVTVELKSQENSKEIMMHRTFNYRDRKPVSFNSRILPVKKNVVIELMRFRFAARLIYSFDKDKITMNYGGYVFRLGQYLIPMPLGFIFGKFYAFERAESDDMFHMQLKIEHPFIGNLFQYDGRFKIVTSHD